MIIWHLHPRYHHFTTFSIFSFRILNSPITFSHLLFRSATPPLIELKSLTKCVPDTVFHVPSNFPISPQTRSTLLVVGSAKGHEIWLISFHRWRCLSIMTLRSNALFSLKRALLILLDRVAAICRCSISPLISCCGFMASPSSAVCRLSIFCLYRYMCSLKICLAAQISCPVRGGSTLEADSQNGKGQKLFTSLSAVPVKPICISRSSLEYFQMYNARSAISVSTLKNCMTAQLVGSPAIEALLRTMFLGSAPCDSNLCINLKKAFLNQICSLAVRGGYHIMTSAASSYLHRCFTQSWQMKKNALDALAVVFLGKSSFLILLFVYFSYVQSLAPSNFKAILMQFSLETFGKVQFLLLVLDGLVLGLGSSLEAFFI